MSLQSLDRVGAGGAASRMDDGAEASALVGNDVFLVRVVLSFSGEIDLYVVTGLVPTALHHDLVRCLIGTALGPAIRIDRDRGRRLRGRGYGDRAKKQQANEIPRDTSRRNASTHPFWIEPT
jgi:hypothetical protein